MVNVNYWKWPDCHFNIIIKESGTSFQFPVLSQNHIKNICHNHKYLTRFQFDSTYDSKLISISVMPIAICSNVYDGITAFEISGFHKNTKI